MSVAGTYHWPPNYYDGLYLDDTDHFGIYWWYDEVLKDDEEVKKIREKIREKIKQKNGTS